MSKKKKSKLNSEQKDFFLKIARLKNPIWITNYLKKDAAMRLVENNFSKLISNPLIKNNILGSTFPIDYKDIETEAMVSQGTLEQEVWWTYLNVIYHSEKINLFISKSEQFNNLLLYAKYEEASNILNEIVSNVTNVSDLAQNISQATKEQATGVAEINKANQ